MVLGIDDKIIDLAKVSYIEFYIGHEQKVNFYYSYNKKITLKPDEEKIKKIMEVVPEEEFYKVIINSKYFTISGDGFYNIFIRKDCLLEIDKAKEGIIFKVNDVNISLTCDDLQYEVIVNKIYGDKVVYV